MDQTSIFARMMTGFAVRAIGFVLAIVVASAAVHEVRGAFDRADAAIEKANAAMH